MFEAEWAKLSISGFGKVASTIGHEDGIVVF
jgi:hypothetical protein